MAWSPGALAAALLPLLPSLLALGTLVGVLVFTAAFTLVERKLMGLHQRREGPDRVGFEGLGQPFADGLKLLKKEIVRPKDSPERRLYLLAPLLSLWVSLTLWALLPYGPTAALCGSEVGLPLLLGVAGLGSYGVIYAGWASANKYALLGSFRAVAQFISYELVFASLFLPLLGAAATPSLRGLAAYQAAEGWFGYLLPIWGLALLTLLAEANRTPFDLPEAEAELVAGFNVEYSSLLFALFFLAEYSGMGFFSGLLATTFFGGWSPLPWGGGGATGALAGVLTLCLKIQLGCVAFVFLRAALPRLRFDQLLALAWKFLFPLVLSLALLALALHHSATLAALALGALDPSHGPPAAEGRKPGQPSAAMPPEAGKGDFRTIRGTGALFRTPCPPRCRATRPSGSGKPPEGQQSAPPVRPAADFGGQRADPPLRTPATGAVSAIAAGGASAKLQRRWGAQAQLPARRTGNTAAAAAAPLAG